ncbi:MAG TPA: hypothetical protein VG245_06010 [Candidatus Dormibacteraeota bacterium]|jgi:hypothetical protein|nr:hypothetical protein [Candidatus Dormibacteraeota bacterium]
MGVPTRRLSIARETVRELGSADLGAAAGGLPATVQVTCLVAEAYAILYQVNSWAIPCG